MRITAIPRTGRPTARWLTALLLAVSLAVGGSPRLQAQEPAAPVPLRPELVLSMGPSSCVTSVAFAPTPLSSPLTKGGKREVLLASGSYDDTVKLWDVATGELRRTLTGHRADVEVVAFSSIPLSSPQGWTEIRVTRRLAEPVLGDLYVLSVGLSQYQNPQFNLKYAANDAESFADLWRPTEGTLYRRVLVTRLIDSQATAEKVRGALVQLAEAATEPDSVAVFLSGHGILRSAQNQP